MQRIRIIQDLINKNNNTKIVLTEEAIKFRKEVAKNYANLFNTIILTCESLQANDQLVKNIKPDLEQFNELFSNDATSLGLIETMLKKLQAFFSKNTELAATLKLNTNKLLFQYVDQKCLEFSNAISLRKETNYDNYLIEIKEQLLGRTLSKGNFDKISANEIILLIAAFLDAKSLMKLMLTCKSFYLLLQAIFTLAMKVLMTRHNEEKTPISYPEVDSANRYLQVEVTESKILNLYRTSIENISDVIKEICTAIENSSIKNQHEVQEEARCCIS